MSRPLTGSREQLASGHWRVSLPNARGSKHRTTHTFNTEGAADHWLKLAIADLENGRELAVPPPADVVSTRRRRPAGTSFREMGDRWVTERYEELRLAGVGRQVTADNHVRKISDWMEERGLTVESMVRAEVKDFQKYLTRRAEQAGHAAVPDGLDPKVVVSIKKALALPQMTASLSTLKRRIKEGDLVATATPASGHLYAIEDLFSDAVMRNSEGGLRRGPRRQESFSQDVVSDIMWVFTQVCLFAEDHGVDVPQDRQSLAVHRTDKAAKPPRQPLGLGQAARIAARLHAVHQIALWLMRVLGLRISEAYGIRVEDVIDNGPRKHGVVYIKAQGGRTFPVRGADGKIEMVDRVEQVKTSNSHRVLVVPAALMDLIRTVVEVFHTAVDGTVDGSASLIPGLSKKNAGGQAAFRAALATAAAAEGIDCSASEDSLDDTFSCQPHDMRRAALSNLNSDKDVKVSHAKRFAGHAAGADVHHLHYALDDPELKPMLQVAKKIQKSLAAELPNGLMIPTTARCTTGNQRMLAADAARIDAELETRGWLVTAFIDEDPLLTADQVAAHLSVTSKTARLWMQEGFVPSTIWANRARGEERRSLFSDVLAVEAELRSITTIHSLAAEIDQPYHTVYQYIRAQKLPLSDRGERGKVIAEDDATAIRAHYAAQAALHARAVPLSVAASTLGITVKMVDSLVSSGFLESDDRAHDGRRMVTRKSVEGQHQQRETSRGRAAASSRRDDLVSWAEAQTMTGLTDAQMDSLVAEGALIREQFGRRRHLTRASVLGYLVQYAPERLSVLSA